MKLHASPSPSSRLDWRSWAAVAVVWAVMWAAMWACVVTSTTVTTPGTLYTASPGKKTIGNIVTTLQVHKSLVLCASVCSLSSCPAFTLTNTDLVDYTCVIYASVSGYLPEDNATTYTPVHQEEAVSSGSSTPGASTLPSTAPSTSTPSGRVSSTTSIAPLASSTPRTTVPGESTTVTTPVVTSSTGESSNLLHPTTTLSYPGPMGPAPPQPLGPGPGPKKMGR
ncbi:uncharacterized protein [Procambarus clarkii]|uniref:uncharacterized protein n=1 Tax=Procambarus clarkii TaxID=6728 RepID=UPI0037440F46